MLSLETERRLSRLLFQTAECERSIERNRQELCSNLNFDVYSVFSILDSRITGKVDATDLKLFISKYGISATRASLQLVINQYDSNRDQKLSLDEFKFFLLTSEDQDLRNEVLLRKVNPITQYIESGVARHIELEASYQEQLETLKKSLVSRHDFNALDAFRTIDTDRLSAIGSFEIRDFLRKNGYSINHQNINAIVRRIDLDGDSRLSYDEFVAGILPQIKNRASYSPKKKIISSPLRKTVTKFNPNKSYFNSPSSYFH